MTWFATDWYSRDWYADDWFGVGVAFVVIRLALDGVISPESVDGIVDPRVLDALIRAYELGGVVTPEQLHGLVSGALGVVYDTNVIDGVLDDEEIDGDG